MIFIMGIREGGRDHKWGRRLQNYERIKISRLIFTISQMHCPTVVISPPDSN